MTINNRTTIKKIAKELFAKNGYEGFSMRLLADKSGAGLSSIYNFFADKDQLLKEIFNETNRQLGLLRKSLPRTVAASDMLRQRIYFQFQNIESVVYVLKYYLHFRPDFLKLGRSGYLPTKAYLHIDEVLSRGIETGEFQITKDMVAKESKVIAHSINGFLLEYYPNPPVGEELDEVVESIHNFLMRSLTNKEVAMK